MCKLVNKVLSVSFTYGESKIFREVDGYSWELPPSIELNSSQSILVRHNSRIDKVFHTSGVKNFVVIEDPCVLAEVEILEIAENFTDIYGNIEQDDLVYFALEIEALSQLKRNPQ